MPLKLSGEQSEAFCSALSKAFTLQKLDQMLFFRLGKDRQDIALGDDKFEIIFKIVTASVREGWTAKLLMAARSSNPGNSELFAFEHALGLGSIGCEAATNLEKIVRPRWNFIDVASFRARYARLENCVCAIETGTSLGTGFLVGPDLVLTNYHVIKSVIGNGTSDAIRCRFDYKAMSDGTTILPGRTIGLAVPGVLASRPYSPADLVASDGHWEPHELDYALLRLAEKVGRQPIGVSAEPSAPARGWITALSMPPHVAKDDPLIIVQHPQDLNALPAVKLQPMQLAIGLVLGFVGDGMRIRHATRTLPGSSGSPCCNANLELVALHHAGDPRDWPDYRGEFNQAIPIDRIVADLKTAKDVDSLWDDVPPAQ
jgi:Trypsin-like peptidase domain/Effector-associated domain 1